MHTIEWDWQGEAPKVGDRVVREGHGGRWQPRGDSLPSNPAGVFCGEVTAIVEGGVEIEIKEQDDDETQPV